MRPMARIATVINLDTCAGCPGCAAARPSAGTVRHGGWELTRRGRLRPRNGGGRLRGLTGPFTRPTEVPQVRRPDRPRTYGGGPAAGARLAFEQPLRVSLRPSCAHCLNPLCGEACPPGASGCAYSSETCVGGVPYLGVMLYDADKVRAAASSAREQDLYKAQLGVFLDPEDVMVRLACERAGITGDWLEAARRSPVRALISTYRVALPPHPEDRTLPMVWYVPPLSPVVDALADGGHDGGEPRSLFGAVDTLRIPLEELAELFTAGDVGPVRSALRRLAAMRSHMRAVDLGEEPDPSVPAAVGLRAQALEELYRLLATAPDEERTVVPAAESPAVIRTTRTPEAEEI
ncbi:hypothetical protein [Streptomyces sp. NPDC046859]|uniref:hypothetical protein n=1 Tax=Streptomyces sp. NPDC046859 TaxID=3155734 RepID=UPI0033CCA68A